MSWRTDGTYSGLSDSDKRFLKEFDRTWDTKALGRSRTDAFDRITQCGLDHINVLNAEHITPTEKIRLEAALLKLAAQIVRVTVPRQNKSGDWSLHMTLDSGNRRVRFDHEHEASQAYYAIKELTLWFSPV